MNARVPAYLCVGASDVAEQQVYTMVCQHLCTNRSACGRCFACRQVHEHQHACVCWLEPDGAYTLAQIEVVSNTLAFARSEQDGPYFFIITRADALNAACANSLLKSVEEPPAGYHFIFTSVHEQAVLPTIRSRCLIQRVSSAGVASAQHALLPFLTAQQPCDALAFAAVLERQNIDEYEATALLDDVLQFWTKAELQKPASACRQLRCLYVQALACPIMPGSGKMLVRALFTRHMRILGAGDKRGPLPASSSGLH